jgi:uncharacterized protein
MARAASTALVAALGLYAFAVEPRWIEVTHPSLHAPVVAPLRVLHLTDLHGESPGSLEEDILLAVERDKPDLIVLTGDTCDHGTFAGYRTFLEKLHAPLGVFAVQGNWEHWSPAADEAGTYEAARIVLLVNESRLLRDDLWIVGFDDATGGAPDVSGALRGVPPGVATIGLLHSPELFDSVAGRVSIAFAGHTHGGQVRAPLLGPLWLPQGCGHYVAGIYQEHGSSLYVSRGLGTSVLPVRFLCRPELALVDVGP